VAGQFAYAGWLLIETQHGQIDRAPLRPFWDRIVAELLESQDSESRRTKKRSFPPILKCARRRLPGVHTQDQKCSRSSSKSKHLLPFGLTGTITRIVGLTVQSPGFRSSRSSCRIHREQGDAIDASVVGFHGDETCFWLRRPGRSPCGERASRSVKSNAGRPVGDRLLGRVLDGRGRFLRQACAGRPPPSRFRCRSD